MAAYKDYYQVLGIARDASEKDVRRAFRSLAAKHHPDRNRDDPGAEERFKEINEAYTVLSDPEKRKVYDRFGAGGPPTGGFAGGGFPGGGYARGGTTFYGNVRPEDAAGFSDFFRSLFGGGVGGSPFGGDFGDDPFAGSTRAAPRPRAVTANLTLELERAFHGGPMSVRVDGKALEVTIPAGVRDGAKLRLRGQAPGGGDLLLVVRHAPHAHWRLDGTTLYVVADVPDHVAVLGGSVRVHTFDGDVDLTVPPGTASGRKLRLRGRGWPTTTGAHGEGEAEAARGDAVAEVRVVVPRAPSDAQREAYQRLRELDAADGG
ncbi:MAG: DnaJ domain-containing protein [Trueperaceae bacterium]|nr:DnaJ domain-containing protein [Trueperaceae bacterium]